MYPIIFTDLDGTLIHFHTYDYKGAIPYVRAVQDAKIPVIFTSSKTYSEQKDLQVKMGIADPLIIENGSAIVIPSGHILRSYQWNYPTIEKEDHTWVQLGKPRDEILAKIENIKASYQFDFKTYHDLSLKEIQAITKLNPDAAIRARDRAFSETVLIWPNVDEEFEITRSELSKAGFEINPGGKFHTITGAESNKGKAINELVKAFRATQPDIFSVGIGDSKNDESMLASVDAPFLVRKSGKEFDKFDVTDIRKIDTPAPEGWGIMAEWLISKTRLAK